MIGEVINNYRVLSHLGNGGFSDVWLAAEESSDLKVALKIIDKSRMANLKFKERFKHGAEILKRLNHPNIVSFVSLINKPDILGVALEYIDGINLEDFIIKNYDPASPLKLMRFFSQLLDAIEYAHQNKVIHRDIKPSNILISRELQAKVIDFDTVKDFADDANFTTANFTVGTFNFISPEQFDNSRNVSPQSDIYSLGLVMFYILVGKPLFSNTQSPIELFRAIEEGKLPQLSMVNKNIPEVFDKILAKALERNPQNRFSSCNEFKNCIENQLDPYLQGGAVDPDKTRINPRPRPEPTPRPAAEGRPVDTDKTVVNPKPQPVPASEKPAEKPKPKAPVEDKTQFFEHPPQTPPPAAEKPKREDATMYYESDNTPVVNEPARKSNDNTSVFTETSRKPREKASTSYEDELQYLDEFSEDKPKNKQSLSAWDAIILIGGIIVFITGMVVLFFYKK